jgi:hypothetical protein
MFPNFSGLTRYFEYDISFTRCQQVKPWRNWQGTGTTTKIKFLLWQGNANKKNNNNHRVSVHYIFL